MDAYAPSLIERGLKGMIGKGQRSQAVRDALTQNKAVYLGATGGAGALLSKLIKKSEVIAFEDLGPEAIHRLEVVDFPVRVINDIYGGDLYEAGVKRYAR
jgi:fumarate hydratase subunit beta